MQSPTVNTKLVVLLGLPLGHSVSPAMHNYAFEKLEMDCCYIPVEVIPENLATVFAGLTKMNVAGFNVTIPYKIEIMNYLDELDPLARVIGAVNTICMEDGRTKGYNTDGEGFVRSLEEKAGIRVKGKRFFILGCGGAVRAIAMTLASKGAAAIYISNRTLSRATNLATEINERISHCAKAVEQKTEAIKPYLQQCDILVNGTRLGMYPDEDISPIETSLLSADLIVTDIVYNPLMTKLLKEARQLGCTVVDGLGMLIYQGAAAFQLWTGVEPPVEEMTELTYKLMTERT
ncbi:MAG: shikimate dehydrogenase [Deltaproteobacteria bacterium]|nr:shikimate dehydrogenase [Deltaproteobacteria bacterium]